MPGGRPSKFSHEVRERILQAISVGAPLEAAAQSAGVSYAAFNRWMRRGEREKRSAFAEFYQAVKEAQGRALVKWLALIDKAAQEGNWAAAAWKVERRYPREFGRRTPEAPERGATLEEILARANEIERERYGTEFGQPVNRPRQEDGSP